MVEIKTDIIPKRFKLQWHITERCNFRCSHCYQDSYDTTEMTLEQMEDILRQYSELLKKWRISAWRAFLTITGGEPFLFKHFFKFLAKVYKYSPYYTWAILSNGSLVTRENIKILRLFKISDYQVSLEGLEEINDKIRGRGNFKRAIEGIKTLIGEGIPVSVSMTLTKENLNDIFPLAKLLMKMGVKTFLVRRLVPWGQGSQLAASLFEPNALLEIFRNIEKEDQKLCQKELGIKILPACENAFLFNNPPKGNYCAVVDGKILALLPNGDVYPCRRLPIKIGNIFENSLEEIYYSEKNREIRDLNQAPTYCKNCGSFKNCFGGAKCITYAYSRRLDIPDVQCPHAYKKLDKGLAFLKT